MQLFEDFCLSDGEKPLDGMSVFFVGIGGVSMSALARLSRMLGAVVSGYDREPEAARRALGVPDISVSADMSVLPAGVALVVYTLAVTTEHPLLREASRRGVRVLSRPAYLGALMRRYRVRIGISGTHGKSTVTAMTDAVFASAGRHPTTLCGAALPFGDTLRPGDREMLIYEACEYRDAFLSFSPTDAVLLDAEWDHTDYFPDTKALAASFLRAGALATERVILSADDKTTAAMAGKFPVPTVTFGRQGSPDLLYTPYPLRDGRYGFSAAFRGKVLGDIRLSVPGAFQTANAAAALTAALCRDIPFDTAAAALAGFGGIERRLQVIGHVHGVPVVYDYAHHPTEIRAGIRTVRDMYGHATVIFRPHTYSRTADLWDGFVSALGEADRIYIIDIYAAREAPRPGVTSAALAAAVGSRASYIGEAELPAAMATAEGALLLMGAGDMDAACRLVAEENAKEKE